MAKSKHKYFNPNPKKREDVGDCVIRAFCKATGKDWDAMFKELCELAFELKALPNSDVTYKEYLKRSHDFAEHKLRIKKGVKRPTVESFAKANKKGTYILTLANHLVAVVDGYYYDTWDCGEKSVYKFWEKVESEDK